MNCSTFYCLSEQTDAISITASQFASRQMSESRCGVPGVFGAPVHSLPEGSGLLMQIRSTLPQRSALHSRDLQGDIASIPPDTPFVLLQSFLDNTFHNWEGLRNDSSPG